MKYYPSCSIFDRGEILDDQCREESFTYEEIMALSDFLRARHDIIMIARETDCSLLSNQIPLEFSIDRRVHHFEILHRWPAYDLPFHVSGYQNMQTIWRWRDLEEIKGRDQPIILRLDEPCPFELIDWLPRFPEYENRS